jgi:hypothetical protein
MQKDTKKTLLLLVRPCAGWRPQGSIPRAFSPWGR